MDHREFYREVAWRLHEMGCQSRSRTRPNPEEALPIVVLLEDWAAQGVEPRINPPVRNYFSHVGGSFEGWISHYLGFAFEGVADLDPSRIGQNSREIHAFRRDSHLLNQQIKSFCRKYCLASTSSYMLHEQPGEVRAAYRVFMTAFDKHLRNLTSLMGILLDMIDVRLDEVSPVAGGRPVERWKRYFVGAMARAWLLLTGSPPKANPHGPFAEFVDCAWHSGGDMPSISWERPIRCLASCISEFERYEVRLQEVVNRYRVAEAA